MCFYGHVSQFSWSCIFQKIHPIKIIRKQQWRSIFIWRGSVRGFQHFLRGSIKSWAWCLLLCPYKPSLFHTYTDGGSSSLQESGAHKNSIITPPPPPAAAVLLWSTSQAACYESRCTAGWRKHFWGTQLGDSAGLLTRDWHSRTHAGNPPGTVCPLHPLHSLHRCFWKSVSGVLRSRDTWCFVFFVVVSGKNKLKVAPQRLYLSAGDCLRGPVYAYLIAEWAAVIWSSASPSGQVEPEDEREKGWGFWWPVCSRSAVLLRAWKKLDDYSWCCVEAFVMWEELTQTMLLIESRAEQSVLQETLSCWF